MFGRKRKPEDFSEELRAHLALEADQLRAEGASEIQAQRAARCAMGNLTSREERFYESSRWMRLDQFRQDLRLALRQWYQSKGFTAVAVLTLALGIGANTAIFTLVNAIVLRSLPVANPERIFRLGTGADCCVNSGYQKNFALYSYPLYRTLRDQSPEFADLAAMQVGLGPLNVRREGALAPQVFTGQFVSGNYFRMWGVSAYAGRALVPADDAAGAPPAAMLSFRAWDQGYGRDPSVVGARLVIDGLPFTIAGVAPPGFYGDTLRADPPDVWLPLVTEAALRGANSLLERGDQHWLYLVGRLQPKVTPGALEAHVNIELKRWFEANSGEHFNRQRIDEQHISVSPAGGGLNNLKEEYAGALRILLAASLLVLLIACANIANLLLARGAANSVQASIRMALGAARGRVIRQTLTESLALSLLGGAAGLAVAYGGARLLLALAFRGSRYVPVDATPSPAVVAFALVVSVATGIVFGVVPAWFASRLDPASALRGAGRSTGRRSTVLQRIPGSGPGGPFAGAAGRRRPAYRQPAQPGAPAVRLRVRKSHDRLDSGGIQRVQSGAFVPGVAATLRQVGLPARRAQRGVFTQRPHGRRQLVQRHLHRRPPHRAGRRNARLLFVAAHQPPLLRNHRHAPGARPRDRPAGHAQRAPGGGGHPGVRPQVLPDAGCRRAALRL